MTHRRHERFFFALAVAITCLAASVILGGCATQVGTGTQSGARVTGVPKLSVVAVESFLADIAQNVAGDRLTVETLLPPGTDPHEFEPSPRDVVKVSQADLLVISGQGLEKFFLDRLLAGAQKNLRIIEASAGLKPRVTSHGAEAAEQEVDPHFWLDPICAKTYVDNIARGLAEVDPAGKTIYLAHAASYRAKLDELDAWVRAEIETIPPDRRLIVTDHESFGYYADRYGLRVVGSILGTASSASSLSAQQLARLIQTVKVTGVKAVFLQVGTSPQLADQIARETGVKVVTNLYTHSLSSPDGPAPNYLELIRHNTLTIVQALR